jgi:hypothetical protein
MICYHYQQGEMVGRDDKDVLVRINNQGPMDMQLIPEANVVKIYNNS